LFSQTEYPTYKIMLNDSLGDFNFYDLKSQYDNYFATSDRGRGSGFKQIMRFENFVERRVAPSGQMFNIPGKNLNNYNSYLNLLNFTTLPSNYDPGNWESAQITSRTNNKGWNGGWGRINCITFSSNGQDCFIGSPAGGVWRASGQWTNWEPLTDGLPNIGISGIGVDPNNSNHIFILTGDGDGYDMSGVGSIGVLESNDNGVTWHPTSLVWDDNALVRGYKLLVHPTNINIQFVVVAGSAGGIANEDGIYKTTDGWNTYTRVNTSSSFYDIEFKPGDPTVVYASTNNDFFRSTSSGDSATFIRLTNGIPSNPATSRVAIGVSPASPSTVYLLYGISSTNNATPCSTATSPFFGFYSSTNSGGLFNLIDSGCPNILGGSSTGANNRSQARYDFALAISPTNSNEIHVGCVNSWVSIDGGQNWNITGHWDENGTNPSWCNPPSSASSTFGYNHADVHAMEYNSVNGDLYCGTDGGFYRASNTGTVTNYTNYWEDRSAGLEISMFYAIATTTFNADFVAGGTQDNGSNWLSFSTNILTHERGGDGFGCVLDYNNSNNWYLTDQGTVHRSLDGGQNWDIITPASNLSTWDVAFIQHPANPATLYISATNGNLYRTTNATSGTFPCACSCNINTGVTWTTLPTGNIGGRFYSLAHGVSTGTSGANRLYAATLSNIFMTPNVTTGQTAATSNWNDITTGLPVASASINGIAVNPTWSFEAFVVFSGYNDTVKVYKTTNAGTSWTNITGSLPNVPVNCIVYDPDNASIDAVYIGTDVGVFYRDNNIGNWVPFFHGLPNVVVEDLEIKNNQIYAGTYGRGVWRSNLYGNCLSVIVLTQATNPTSSTNNAQTYYAASSWISSERTIYSSIGDSVRYQAGMYVKLIPGFNTQSGANFQAKIDQCYSSSSSNSNARLMSARDAIVYRCYGTLVP
jgi:hypothetical protein